MVLLAIRDMLLCRFEHSLRFTVVMQAMIGRCTIWQSHSDDMLTVNAMCCQFDSIARYVSRHGRITPEDLDAAADLHAEENSIIRCVLVMMLPCLIARPRN